MASFPLGRTAVYVGADEAGPISLYNAGAGTVYYKSTPDVSASSFDGQLAATRSIGLSSGVWAVTDTSAIVTVADVDTRAADWPLLISPPWPPMVGAAPGAPGANVARFVRALVPVTGIMVDVTYYIGASSGNCILMAYDVGEASPGNYTKLWDSGSLPVGTVNTWQSASPGIPVKRGQQVMLGVMFDNGTATLGRGSLNLVNAAASQLPANFIPDSGSNSAKLNAQRTFGGFSADTTIPEANMVQNTTNNILFARVA